MPCISFATGGDANDYDMIGYVAKDARNMREVHVFDCGHMAHDVIATVGQAFELRFKSFLAKQTRGTPGTMSGAANLMYLQQAGVPQEDLYSDAPSTFFLLHTPPFPSLPFPHHPSYPSLPFPSLIIIIIPHTTPFCRGRSPLRRPPYRRRLWSGASL
jgi:hypothetical protein